MNSDQKSITLKHLILTQNYEPSKHQQKLNCSNKKWLNMYLRIPHIKVNFTNFTVLFYTSINIISIHQVI